MRLRRLRIWCCHCCGSGHWFGTGTTPGQGSFTCCRRGHKEKRKRKEDVRTSTGLYRQGDWPASEGPSLDCLDTGPRLRDEALVVPRPESTPRSSCNPSIKWSSGPWTVGPKLFAIFPLGAPLSSAVLTLAQQQLLDI